jgi:hypothetical protein
MLNDIQLLTTVYIGSLQSVAIASRIEKGSSYPAVESEKGPRWGLNRVALIRNFVGGDYARPEAIAS